MKTLNDLPDVQGKRVLLSLDLNVPLVDGVVFDDFRIRKSFPTIDLLLGRGAQLVIMSHISAEGGSLRPTCTLLEKKYKMVFVPDFFPETPPSIAPALADGAIVLLENLRKYPGEMANDEVFARHLASFGKYYVNEAFPDAHRAHASMVSVPKFLPSFAGLTFADEVKNLSKVFTPKHPFLVVLGGAKLDTKIPLAEKFFMLADTMFVGGALVNDFLKAKGLPVGKSLMSQGNFDLKPFLTSKLILPVDVVVEGVQGKETKRVEDVLSTDIIYDVGPESISALNHVIHGSSFILWNGPLGNYEKGFKEGTESLAKAIAESPAESIVGGGDTIASIASLNLSDKFTFISTGGGAMLEFLANETLPGIEALNASK